MVPLRQHHSDMRIVRKREPPALGAERRAGELDQAPKLRLRIAQTAQDVDPFTSDIHPTNGLYERLASELRQ